MRAHRSSNMGQVSLENIYKNKQLVLPRAEVHVWPVSLDQPDMLIHRLVQTLSLDEQSRAERFHSEQDRQHFIVGRSVLRILLSQYMMIRPNQITFQYKSNGKPYLTNKYGGETLCFNLAHSNKLALYSFACARQVGIDLEYIRSLPDAEQIATRFFSACENAALYRLTGYQKLEAFFSCWTRKEAYIKAIGYGLSYPINQFDVTLAPGEPARLLNVEGYPGEVDRWSLKAFVPAPGYIAALAVEGFDWRFILGNISNDTLLKGSY